MSPIRLSVVLLASAMIALLASRSFSADTANEWKAPPDAAAKQNPVVPDEKSNAAGKRLYVKNCQACHGVAGHGDGPAAYANKPRPRDLSEPQIASQTDGEFFWKITTGKKPMPGYEQKLTEEQRWQVVNYLRVLEPRPTTKP
jgi:mono/diheme cytochrome c family protein